MKRTSYGDQIIKNSHPLSSTNELSELRPLIDSIKDKKIVMLGEASHGTKEFYEWRSIITKELIFNHGYQFVAVEGDWPPCQEINNYIHNKSDLSIKKVLATFSRWPTWMWANEEMIDLIEWLKASNSHKKHFSSFYGLDVYSLYESIDQVINLLFKIDPGLSLKAKNYYSCFDPYRHDEKAYARSLFQVSDGCKENVLAVLNEALQYKLDNTNGKAEILFDAIQNARIACNAENYYRAMIFGEEDSWNVRDTHMMETLQLLLKHHGPNAKGIVWAHNTHIGDYRATDMVTQGQINLGGLVREKLGRDNVALVGFSTYTGSVIAAHSWDGLIQVMPIPKAVEGSVESEFHKVVSEVGSPNFYTLLQNEYQLSPLAETRGQRAIGVVYHPPSEHRGNYVPTILSERYDAFVFFDETESLTPLKVKVDYEKIPETYPYGTHL